jgi:hypothetical protein
MITARKTTQQLRGTLPRASSLTLLGCVFVCWMNVATAVAQGGPISFDRVEEYIQRTEEILMRAAEAVRESESARARPVLAQARELHDRSVSLLMNGRPLIAYETSQRARQAAQHAVQLARDDLGFEERVRIRLERLRELYDQLFERAQEERNERALRFIQEAERQFLRAREQYTQRNFEIAFHLLESAESLLHKAARLLFEGAGVDRLRNDLDRTADLIRRTRERLGEADDRAAQEILDRAERVLEQARDALSRGEPLAALHLARQARRLVGQAAGRTGAGPSREAVQEQIERWDRRHGEIAPAVRESGHDPALRMLERARSYRQRAGATLAAGDGEEALRQIKLAHDLLAQASELAR